MKVYKGRFETHRVGTKRHPRHVIGDEQLRDDFRLYAGEAGSNWTRDGRRARLYYRREDAEVDIEGIARRDPLLEPEDRYTLEVEITTLGAPEREDVERLLRDALAVGLRRVRFRPDRSFVDSLVVIDPETARLRPWDGAASDEQPEHGAS
ncbi:hypothetical protein [Tautonia plasticadhaerens]|uniref:Uncharacterized protein n=1 Tax=Tautonia plasticadhaerens TaxID=2527974 RepID=A0A518H9K0_9BACT|nr:hypothetical protein [Tautonia plasticadhaerens]QDV37542.1 hypothetical protein ElP_54820 [Tautonia plasticadhaerens]